jgi:hypothetical protein
MSNVEIRFIPDETDPFPGVNLDNLGPANQAINHNEGKPRWSLLLKDFPNALEEVLKVREFGCQKYDRDNWSLSMGDPKKADTFTGDCKESVFRHLMKDWIGDRFDGESEGYHVAHIALRCLMILEYYHNENQNDD